MQVRVARVGGAGQAVPLSVLPVPPGSSARAWGAGPSPSTCAYYGLFPRAWTVYDNPVPGIKLVCKQVYQMCSLQLLLP